jgi:glycosyltransferase involved in cell wall biosynthesis
MRILHLSEFYGIVGGQEQHLLGFCEVCEAAGHQTAIVYATTTGREPSAPRPSYWIASLAGPIPASPQDLQILSGVLAREAPDVIVIHEILEPQVIRFVASKAPTIRFVHGYKMICPGGRRLWTRSGKVCERSVGLACQAIAYVERCMPRDPRQGLPLIARARELSAIHQSRSEVIVPSNFLRGLLLRNRFPSAHVHVVPYFTTLPTTCEEPCEPVPGRLLCAARLTAEKGVDHVLRALALLPPPAHLVVAGEGPARAQLGTLAAAHGIQDRVRFTGWLSRAAMAEVLRDAAILVFPSLGPETFGIVGIEAMAHRRPVVAYDAGGVREWLVSEETGYLVPRGDIRGLTEALRTLLRDPERRRTFGVQGRRAVEHRFLPEHHLRRFLDVAEVARARWRRLDTRWRSDSSVACRSASANDA